MCAQLLLQLLIDLSETLHMLLSLSDNMHSDLVYSLNNFAPLFRILNLAIFLVQIVLECIDSRYLVCAVSPTVIPGAF